jgi:hypothetical protein
MTCNYLRHIQSNDSGLPQQRYGCGASEQHGCRNRAAQLAPLSQTADRVSVNTRNPLAPPVASRVFSKRADVLDACWIPDALEFTKNDVSIYEWQSERESWRLAKNSPTGKGDGHED